MSWTVHDWKQFLESYRYLQYLYAILYLNTTRSFTFALTKLTSCWKWIIWRDRILQKGGLVHINFSVITTGAYLKVNHKTWEAQLLIIQISKCKLIVQPSPKPSAWLKAKFVVAQYVQIKLECKSKPKKNKSQEIIFSIAYRYT